MAPSQTTSIWQQMGYTPPRGPCNHRQGLLSSRCPCQRFMLHPLKVSGTFQCDGCNHHASFHNMENKQEDAIVRRWREEEVRIQLQEEWETRPRKIPRRAIEHTPQASIEEQMAGPASSTTVNRKETRPRTRTRKQPVAPSLRTTRSRRSRSPRPDTTWAAIEIRSDEEIEPPD